MLTKEQKAEVEMILGELTDPQRVYVEEFVSNGFKKSQAMKASGHSIVAHGRESICQSPKIRDKIIRVLEAIGLTPEAVIEGLLMEARGELGDSRAADRIKAWEDLGKHLGMFSENRERTEAITVEFKEDWNE